MPNFDQNIVFTPKPSTAKLIKFTHENTLTMIDENESTQGSSERKSSSAS